MSVILNIFGALKNTLDDAVHRAPPFDDGCPIPLRIVFVRHAEAEVSDGHHSSGPGLTARGRRQANRVAHRLASQTYNYIYASDLLRAKETARSILRYHPNTPSAVLKELREVSSNHSSIGMSRATVERHADTVNEQLVMTKVVHAIRRNHDPGEEILIVAHGNIIRGMIPLFGGLDPNKAPLCDLNNTSVSIIDVWNSGRALIRLINCTHHLPRRLCT